MDSNDQTASQSGETGATDESKWFNCQSCGKSLSANEVVPIFMTGCCGFIAACRDCAGPDRCQVEPATGPAHIS